MCDPALILSVHMNEEPGTERKSVSLLSSKEQEGRCRELQASQLYLDTWESDGVNLGTISKAVED